MKKNPFIQALEEHFANSTNQEVHSYVFKSRCKICGEQFALVFHLKVYKDMHDKYAKLDHCPKCEMLAIIHEYNRKFRGRRF